MSNLWRTFVVLVVVGLIGVTAWTYAVAWHPSVEHYPVQGVDVSEANGALDWRSIAAAGADFGYAVATVGSTRRDATFEANWRDIDEAGIRRGAVHVYSLCQLAADQANAFNTVVPRDAEALPAAIDLSYDERCNARPDRAVLVDELARFATMIERHVGKPVLLRLSPEVESDYRLSAALPRGVWATGNVFPPAYAERPWRMWRASDFRRIDGVENAVNWDVVAK